MLLLVFDQLLLRGLYLHLQVDKLLRKPVRSLHGRFETRFEVLLDIGVNQRIYDMRGQILIGAAVMDIDDARIRPERNLQAPLERRQQFRGAGRVRLERVSGQLQRRRLSVAAAAKFWPLIKIELLDDLKRKQVASQNAELDIQVRGLVVDCDNLCVLQIERDWIDFILEVAA